MFKKVCIFLGVLLLAGIMVAFVFAASAPLPVCGDGIVQSPNSNGQREKCDEGASNGQSGSDCTATCGQKLLGWAWSDNLGWISLNKQTCEHLHETVPPATCGPQGIDYYVQASENDQVLGWAWADTAGWVCFGTTCTGTPPAGNIAVTILTDDPEAPSVNGWAKITSQGDNGWVSLNCSNASECTTSNYAVHLTNATFNGEQRRTLSGWGWNGGDSNANDEADFGFGWMQFNPPILEIPAWLQTRYGDIYARRGLSGQPSPGYNATYRILSGGGITQFTSAQGQSTSWVSPEFGRINFPTPETRYSNILGRLDVAGLTCQFNVSSGTCINRYGTTVKRITGTPPTILNGIVYVYEGDVTLGSVGSTIQFNNASDFDSAAGTIIVRGNLTINGDMVYEPSTALALTRFKNLASVAWIVEGDVRVAPEVQSLVGNFVVIGNGTACDPDADVPGCGQFFSCSGSGCDNPLTVSGLVMARKFKLDRTYRNQLQGSEVIIYDGRLLANTPPGLTDFAKALPIWRSGTFAQ